MKIRKHIISRFNQFKREKRPVLSVEKSEKPGLFDAHFDGKIVLRMNAHELKELDLKVSK